MVSAAKGAEDFYTIEEHASRTEGIEQARALDTRAAEAWVGHPYVDLVDNSDSNFDAKINSLISKVAWSIGIDVGDRYDGEMNMALHEFLYDYILPPISG